MRTRVLFVVWSVFALVPAASAHPLEEFVNTEALSACADTEPPSVRIVEEPTCAGGTLNGVYLTVRCIVEKLDACYCVQHLPQCLGVRVRQPDVPYLP